MPGSTTPKAAGTPPLNPFRHDPALAIPGSAWPRLLSLLLASAASGLCPEYLLLLPIFTAFSALLASGEKPLGILRSCRFLMPLAFFIALPNIIEAFRTPAELPALLARSLVYLARLVTITLLARVFYKTTSTQAVADSLSALARSLPGRQARRRDPGLYLGLSVAFLPRCFERYTRVREAALARGYGSPAHSVRTGAGTEVLAAHRMAAASENEEIPGNPRRKARQLRQTQGFGILFLRRWRSLAAIAETTIISLLGSAVTTAWALEARGYDPGRRLSPEQPRKQDLAILAASAVFTAVSFLLA